jgi:tetratricopeptide (TPR) repeat protein
VELPGQEPAAEPSAAPAEAVEPSSAAAPPAAQPVQDEAPIRITRTRAVPEASRLLREAYTAFQAGDFNTARLHYLAVLEDQPENLDALMGMGAIAMKEGDDARVAEYFSRVLRLDPRNELATAALIGRQRGRDPVAMESALKNLLNARPDSAYLYFSLGNVYAAQKRWAEAQQAFFDAYSNDSSNPDYALNLAASLDRMGQREAALDYYRVALKLAEERTASFDPAPVQRRIEALSALDP